jgi:AI-2 transport protein TqsA
MTDIDDNRADEQVRTVCLLILTVIAVGVALYLLRAVMVPFLLALFFTYCLTPLVNWQVRSLRLPRSVAIGGAALVGLALVVLVGVFAADVIAKVAANLGPYQDQVGLLLDRVAESAHLEKLGLVRDDRTGAFLTLSEATRGQIFSSLVTSIADLLATGSLVLIFMTFMLLGSKGEPRPVGSLLGAIEAGVQRYVLLLVAISLVTALLVGFTLMLLGVEFAWVFGFLAFLLNFIPTIGSIIATLLPLPVILMDPGLSPPVKVLAVLIPGAIQFTIGNLIQPRIMGQSQNLHPVVILLALIFFGTIWGIVGAVLAVPITGVLRVALERIPAMHLAAAWLEGKLEGPAAAKKPAGGNEF